MFSSSTAVAGEGITYSLSYLQIKCSEAKWKLMLTSVTRRQYVFLLRGEGSAALYEVFHADCGSVEPELSV